MCRGHVEHHIWRRSLSKNPSTVLLTWKLAACRSYSIHWIYTDLGLQERHGYNSAMRLICLPFPRSLLTRYLLPRTRAGRDSPRSRFRSRHRRLIDHHMFHQPSGSMCPTSGPSYEGYSMLDWVDSSSCSFQKRNVDPDLQWPSAIWQYSTRS